MLGPGPFELAQEIMDHVLRNHVPHNRPMSEWLHTRWSGVSDSVYKLYVYLGAPRAQGVPFKDGASNGPQHSRIPVKY